MSAVSEFAERVADYVETATDYTEWDKRRCAVEAVRVALEEARDDAMRAIEKQAPPAPWVPPSAEVVEVGTAPAEPQEFFVVLALHASGDGITNGHAVLLRDEMEAHDVATTLRATGCRAFFVNTSGDDGAPTVEEYGVDDDG